MSSGWKWPGRDARTSALGVSVIVALLALAACKGPEKLTSRMDGGGNLDAAARFDTIGGSAGTGGGSDGAPDQAPTGLVEGAACGPTDACASGFCVDGVCCGTACEGTCMTCAAVGSVGTCVAADVATDPRDQCPLDDAATCGRDGFCDGAGACRKVPQGTICSAASCTGATMTLASRCDADSKCPAPPTQSCAPYLCGAGGTCPTVCAKDTDCASPNACIATSCGKKPLGGACTAAAECNSGLCEQGTCCSAECKGICRSCGLAGTAGICSIIPAGQDPLGQCADSGAASCGLDGACDGTGACRKYISGTTCTAASCTAGTERGTARCDGAGVCVAGVVRACAPFLCGGAGSCSTACAVAADCAPDYSCIGGACRKKSGGAACTTAAECGSGACQQGVCCDKLCPGPCQACNLAGAGGVCSMVPAGQDPLNQCADQGLPTCGTDGACNGQGACRRYVSGSVCAAGTCAGSTFTPQSVCNGTGTCVAGGALSCSPYLCSTGTTCRSACTTNADCTTGNLCLNASCGKKPPGGTCTMTSDCMSGFCAQGICCVTACAGTCQSCALPGKEGTCTPVPAGQDPLNQCADQGAPSCGTDGACDGAGVCERYVAGTTCATATCAAGTYTQARTCNGTGTCQAGTTSSCDTYACNTNGTCHTTCTTATDCAAGYVCNAGACSKKLNGATCGAGPECQSGQCAQGVCCASSCTGSCRSCAMTGSVGTCTLVASGQDPLNQCADQGAPSCGTDGTCDGTGACHLYTAGTTCGATACAGSTFTSAPLCNGAGVCGTGTQSSCTPYQCGTTGTCLATCTASTQCVSPNTCNANACGKKSTGSVCTQDVDCASNFCAQGVCCATACGGTCQSCAQTGSLGTCKVVPAGQDLLNQCADQGAASCGTDGNCDGSGACRRYGSGTVCVAATCAVSTFTPARTCNGTGTCAAAAGASCGRYHCSGTGCLSTCTTSADCTSPMVCGGGKCGGLKGEYFDNNDLTVLKVTRYDPNVNFDWGAGSPDPTITDPGYFSVRWTGTVTAAFTQTYTFYTTSDDGARLWVNGTMLIDNWMDHLPTETSGTIALTAGQAVSIRLEFYDANGNASISMSWSSPSTPKAVVPTGALAP